MFARLRRDAIKPRMEVVVPWCETIALQRCSKDDRTPAMLELLRGVAIPLGQPGTQLLAAVFMMKGLPVLAAVEIQTLFVCRYSLTASMPFSLPRPELL